MISNVEDQILKLFAEYWWFPLASTFSGSLRYYQNTVRRAQTPSFFSCMYEVLVVSMVSGLMGLLITESLGLSVQIVIVASIVASHQGEEWMQHISRILIKILENSANTPSGDKK